MKEILTFLCDFLLCSQLILTEIGEDTEEHISLLEYILQYIQKQGRHFPTASWSLFHLSWTPPSNHCLDHVLEVVVHILFPLTSYVRKSTSENSISRHFASFQERPSISGTCSGLEGHCLP
jgi:hypothetical protein